MKRILATIVAVAALAGCGGTPEAKTYTELNDLVLDVHNAGIDCLAPFITTGATTPAVGSAICESNAEVRLFTDHWDRGAYIMTSLGLELLAGPNWTVSTDDPDTLRDLQNEIGGIIWYNGKMLD